MAPPAVLSDFLHSYGGGGGIHGPSPPDFRTAAARQKFGFAGTCTAEGMGGGPRKPAPRTHQYSIHDFHPPLVLPSFLFDDPVFMYELAAARPPKPQPQPPQPQQQPPQPPAQMPDIDWQPNVEKYRERVRRNKASSAAVPRELPHGYPRMLRSPAVWSRADMEGREDKYVFRLAPAEVAEAERAMEQFTASGQPMSALCRATFPLPTLGPRVAQMSQQLDSGCGFFVLRGFEPRNYSSEENVVLYTGIASYVADRRGRQDENGNMLLHLVDLGSQVAPDNVRQAPYSNVAQPFHTDLGEIIGLYALEQAAHGGKSKLASMGKVYNELAAHRPDYIHTLHRPDWIFDRFGQNPPYLSRPLLYKGPENSNTASGSSSNANMTLAFSRRLLTGSKVSPRSKGIPPMTEQQAEALDAVHFTAEKHCLTLECRRGDMQFWNNLSLLHAREGFEDDREKGMRRHLLRLWLKKDDSPWKSPKPLEGLLEDVYGDIKPGSGVTENWPIVPILDYDHVTTRKRSSGHG